MANLSPFLLVEDNSNDIQNPFARLTDGCVVGEALVFEDRRRSPRYSFCRGAFRNRISGEPVIVLTSSKQELVSVKIHDRWAKAFIVESAELVEFYEALRNTSTYRAVVNEPSSFNACAYVTSREYERQW